MMGSKDKKTIEVTGPQSPAPPEPADPTGTGPTGPDAPPAAGGEASASAVDELRRQLEEEKDRNLRLRAEQQNMQRRVAQERIEAVRYANADFIRSLLTPIDDLERTLTHGEGGGDDSVLRGVRLIYDNFMKVLNEHHVAVIDPLDAAFDPRYHEALMQQPHAGKAPGTVIQVLQRGYRLHDRVLRPAKVILAAPSAADAAAASPEH